MLGKRKREAVVVRRPDGASDRTSVTEPVDRSASDVFRKYFEATFDPLPQDDTGASTTEEEDIERLVNDVNDSHEDSDDESNWSGISDGVKKPHVVEVLDHAATLSQTEASSIDKIFQKSFMGSKPPREALRSPQISQISKSPDDDDVVEEKNNLKHDLDLQRLLKESHLLEQTKQKSDGGKQRHKATDMRMRSLGSRTSLFDQEKMPMSHRKGILSKASSKDAQRRKEAKENGIILEKTSKKPTVSGSRRDRGVDVPVVGKFKGGTLQLSRKDIASIQGPRRGGSKRGRR